MKVLIQILMKILSGILFVLASGASQASSLTIAIIQEWTHFNPVNLQVASTQALLNFTVRRMVQRDVSGAILPDLAENVPTLKNKKVIFKTEKGMRKVVATWTIRPQAKWGDGVEVTCADWHLGWQAGLSPNVTVTERTAYQKIEKIEWKENAKKICTVTYANDDWAFDRDLPDLLPSHLEGPIFEKEKNKSEAYERQSLYVKEPTKPGLYNGPYLISQYSIGSHFVLKPNPYFYGEKPKIESITVKHMGDTSTLRAQLSSGTVNMISANGFPADVALILDEASKQPQSSFVVKFQDSPIYQGLFLNTENEFLKELAVRKALSLAVNKKEISQTFFRGKIFPAESIFPLQNRAHRIEKVIYNPFLAKKTLEDAGWKLNAKKIFEKNGKELQLEFMTSAGIKILETLQVYICDNFLRIGVKCIIKNQTPRIFLGHTVPHGEFAMGMFGQSILPDNSLTGSFSSKEIPTAQRGWAGGNNTRWKSIKADELLGQIDKEWNIEKRVKLMQAFEDELLKDMPVIPLYHRREAFVMPKNLKGFSEDIAGVDFIFPEKWWLE